MTAPSETKPLRIVYVWDADYPWDVRTEKTCLALTEAGHDVHIVARNRAQASVTERLPEATVHRMMPWHWAGRKLDDALGFPAFFNPRWRAHIAKIASSVKADLIIVRDLPLCPTAIRIGRRLRVPVILDMAENYPAMMRDVWTAGRHRITDYLVRNPKLVSAVEKYCVRHVDHIITVVEASSDRLRRMGVAAKQLSVISNTPPAKRTIGRPLKSKQQSDRQLNVVYLGLLEIPRGLNELIDAIKLLHDAGHVEFKAVIVGSGRDEQVFRKRAITEGLSPSAVEFLWRLPHEKALEVVAASDIGVIPHHTTESWRTTIPNKLFDYMSFGIPVVSSDAPPCVTVLAETGAGVSFRSGDASQLAEAILAYRSPEKRHTAGVAGVAAIRDRYNWEADSARLDELVQRIERRA
ncbi:MAG: glycosyltransferase family 4 protein [Gemmatimonadaceae bacterium]